MYTLAVSDHIMIAHSFNGGFTVVLADGALGVLPDSELTWGQDTQAAKDVLEVGQFLKAKITGKRSQTRRLQLSARECVTHPLEDATALKSLEGELQGTIAKIVDYGVFVSLPIGLNGLLHKTVFPEGATFRKGQAICVRVLSIDVERRRISLGVAVPTD